VVARAKDAGALVLYQVGSLADAPAAEKAGADILIAQGFEAGGHVLGRTGILTLLPEIIRHVRIPVVASGGFATGAGLVAALALGAAGIHCGTLFLATHESFAHAYHKQRILAAQVGDTVYTDLFAINWPPHSPVRVLSNSLTANARNLMAGHHPDELPRKVIANDNGRPIYRFSTDSPLRSTEGNLEEMALFAGESAALVNTASSVAEVIERLLKEALIALSRIEQLYRKHYPNRRKTMPQVEPHPQIDQATRSTADLRPDLATRQVGSDRYPFSIVARTPGASSSLPPSNGKPNVATACIHHIMIYYPGKPSRGGVYVPEQSVFEYKNDSSGSREPVGRTRPFWGASFHHA
jgi:hypothetical protein